MNHQKLTTKLEGYRTRNSNNHHHINDGLYRMLYDRDIYCIAYNNIKSNDGALNQQINYADKLAITLNI